MCDAALLPALTALTNPLRRPPRAQPRAPLTTGDENKRGHVRQRLFLSPEVLVAGAVITPATLCYVNHALMGVVRVQECQQRQWEEGW